MSGHLAVKRTIQKVLSEFFWPGISSDIKRHCRSCDICQLTIAKGKTARAPLSSMPIIDTPFQRVAIDLVGPPEPRTDSKNKNILTLVDYATRYPEAVALPSIETETVVEALVSILSRVGVPKEVLTDMVSQIILILVQYVSICMFLIQMALSLYQFMSGIMHRRYVERGESQRTSQLQVYSTFVLDDRSEMLHEKYEGLVESPSISDDGEIDIYISLDIT